MKTIPFQFVTGVNSFKMRIVLMRLINLILYQNLLIPIQNCYFYFEIDKFVFEIVYSYFKIDQSQYQVEKA